MSAAKKKSQILAGCLLALFLVGWIDWVTGYEMGLSLLYLIPISISTWFVGIGAGLLFAVVGAIVWGWSDWAAGHQYSAWFLPYWNSGIRLGFFVVTSISLAIAEATARRQRATIESLTGALAQATAGGAPFPLCPSCKRVRTDAEFVRQVESFAAQHPEVVFSHRQCPACQAAAGGAPANPAAGAP